MLLTLTKINQYNSIQKGIGYFRYELSVPFKDIPQHIVNLALILAALQIYDGLFTAMGVHIYGTQAEANPIIRFLMESYGTYSSLIIVKSVTILAVIYLLRLSKFVSWVQYALLATICIYYMQAILPWAKILGAHYLS